MAYCCLLRYFNFIFLFLESHSLNSVYWWTDERKKIIKNLWNLIHGSSTGANRITFQLYVRKCACVRWSFTLIWRTSNHFMINHQFLRFFSFFIHVLNKTLSVEVWKWSRHGISITVWSVAIKKKSKWFVNYTRFAFFLLLKKNHQCRTENVNKE